MELKSLLAQFGLSDKEVTTYLALVELGPSPVRSIAAHTKINRGSTYDALKALKEQGLVTFHDTENHQRFAVEAPERLLTQLESRQKQLSETAAELKSQLPELRAVYDRRGGAPLVKSYEGIKGIKSILEDVLESVAKSSDKTYRVYSASTVRQNVHQAMPDFSAKRVKAKVKVKTIALGGGGQLVGLDERKWLELPKGQPSATYEILYAGKVAHISLALGKPVGVVIHNHEIYETQKLVFDYLWDKI